jgi:hypothetical protein
MKTAALDPLPAQPILSDAPSSPACLYCVATQASVLRQREILELQMGYSTECVCCHCQTGNACPQCLSENLANESYDFGSDPVTGYSDSGERYRCRDCGATGEMEDTAPVPVILPQPVPIKRTEVLDAA